mgnify:CR=1 FL=1
MNIRSPSDQEEWSARSDSNRRGSPSLRYGAARRPLWAVQPATRRDSQAVAALAEVLGHGADGAKATPVVRAPSHPPICSGPGRLPGRSGRGLLLMAADPFRMSTTRELTAPSAERCVTSRQLALIRRVPSVSFQVRIDASSRTGRPSARITRS